MGAEARQLEQFEGVEREAVFQTALKVCAALNLPSTAAPRLQHLDSSPMAHRTSALQCQGQWLSCTFRARHSIALKRRSALRPPFLVACMTTLTLSDYAHELLAFQPDDFHWPTAFVTALSLIIFYFTNKLIARAVSSTTAVPPHQPASAASPAASTTFDASKLLDFYLLVGRLKTTKRTGWVDHNVPLPESISDHMYRLTLILYTLLPNTATTDRIASSTSNTYLPQQQALLMSLTHDLAECIAGDITPTEYSGVTKESKHKLEADAMQHILTHLPAAQRTQVHSLWRDYEEDGGAISRLLHDCDKVRPPTH